MDKQAQQVSIAYVLLAILLIFVVQNFIVTAQVETISHSQFEELAKKGLIADVAIGDKAVRAKSSRRG